jgi:hypothetical protein
MHKMQYRWVVLALSIAWVSMAYAGTITAPKPQSQPGAPAAPTPPETPALPPETTPPAVPSTASINLTDTESMMRTAGQAVALGTTAGGLAVGGIIITTENPQLKTRIKKVLNFGRQQPEKIKEFTGDQKSWKAYPLQEVQEKGLITPNSTVQLGPQAAHYNAMVLINHSTVRGGQGYAEAHINSIERALTALRIADNSSGNPKYYNDAMERLARRVPPGPAREFVNKHLQLHKIGTEEPKEVKV